MFGDWHWNSDRTECQERLFSDWIQWIKKQQFQLVIIEIGAGEAIPTVRYKSELIASMDSAALIRINPRDYRVPAGHFGINAGGLEGINKILVDSL